MPRPTRLAKALVAASLACVSCVNSGLRPTAQCPAGNQFWIGDGRPFWVATIHTSEISQPDAQGKV